MQPMWLAFLTGLATGGLSCLAVQGGLLASSIASSTQTVGEGPAEAPAQPCACLAARELLRGFGDH